MNTLKAFIRASVLGFAVAASAQASLEGLPEKYTVRANSRPCCGFTPSPITKLTGTSGFIGPRDLGNHDFGQLIKKKKVPRPAGHPGEGFGQIFTCQAGFVDVAHLRDNADWAATIYRELLEKIGTGATLKIRKESCVDRAEIVLPVMSPEARAKLTPEMMGRIATALTFDLALYHEIATAFPQAVSGPRIPVLGDHVVNERTSSFSIEDAYSNLLGAHLGIAAAFSPLRYNDAMSVILDETLDQLDAQKESRADAVYASLKGTWWKGGPFHGYLKLRNRSYEHSGEILPKIPTTRTAKRFCGEVTPSPLDVPSVTSVTGLPHLEVAYIRQFPNRVYRKHLNKLGVTLNEDGSLTRDQFDLAIEKIREAVQKRLSNR